MEFDMGDEVEIASKEIGFEGSYYAAKVITPVFDNEYMVQYKSVVKGDYSGPLEEVVTGDEVRPVPPEVQATGFQVGEKVDAFGNDGWWVGEIAEKIGANYLVYFEDYEVEIPYPPSKLRVHQDWVNGKWVSSKKKNFASDAGIYSRL